MPWKEETHMSLRNDFVQRATQPDTNFTKLCQSFNISRKNAMSEINLSPREDETYQVLCAQAIGGRHPHCDACEQQFYSQPKQEDYRFRLGSGQEQMGKDWRRLRLSTLSERQAPKKARA